MKERTRLVAGLPKLLLACFLIYAVILVSVTSVFAKHIKISTRGYIHSSPLLYDINQDGYQEILVGDMAGYVYCFGHAGNLLWEYYAGDAFDKAISPVPEWFNPEVKENEALGNITIQSSCTAGDIDGDGIPEIIVGIGGWTEPEGSPGGGTSNGFGPVGQGGILILNNTGGLKLLIRGWDTMDGLENQLQDGFSDGFYSTAGIADLNNDGVLDFAISGVDQNIYAYKTSKRQMSKNASGKTLKFYHPPGLNGFWTVPIFELDDDGDGKFNEDPIGDCTPLTYFHQRPMFTGYEGVDDDLDGAVDEGTDIGLVTDDDEDAWPQKSYNPWDDVDEDEYEWPFRSTDASMSSPALADITGDGFMDVIVGTASSGGGPLKNDRKRVDEGGALRVLDLQALEVGDFPRWLPQTVVCSPSVADINGDGNPEIFVGTGPYFRDESGEWVGKGLYAYNSDGTSFLNLGLESPYDALFAMTDNVIWAAPAIGDINGDGDLEVVAADFSGYVYAWDKTGASLPGFPVLALPAANYPGQAHNHVRSSPILVDVDSDGLPEIVLGVGWQILALNGDGTAVPDFMYPDAVVRYGCADVFASPAAGDLDRNGKIDLVWATGESENCDGIVITRGLIHIWELGDFNKDANPWPMFKRTGARVSNYALHLENPIFHSAYLEGFGVDLLTVSVEVYPGLFPVTGLNFKAEIAGEVYRSAMADDGTNGDLFAGDGRYTTRFALPKGIGVSETAVFSVDENRGVNREFKFAFNFLGLQAKSSVGRYYRDILDRLPESGGVEGWGSEIVRIVGLGVDVKEGFIALAKFFFNSDEYLLRSKTNSEYVVDLYETFLNRTPSGDEIAYWNGFLEQGLARNVILNYFAYSEEFRLYMEGLYGSVASRAECNLVNDFYRGFLARLPDSGGFDGWLTWMRDSQCIGAEAVRTLSHTIASGFVSSGEYASRNRTNREYVEDLYNGILRRGARVDEFEHWVNFLDAGTYDREQLLTFFTDSAEFQSRVDEVIDAGCLK